MLEKHLEALGELTARKHLEERTITDVSIERAIESVTADIERSRAEIEARIKQAENLFTNQLNVVNEESDRRHIEQLQKLIDQLKAQEVFEAMLTTRLAEIKDGEKGDTGDEGKPGLDGLDRPLLEPVELKVNKDYPKNTLGTYGGGLWISTKQTVGCPDDDPHSWSCILDAMADMSVELKDDRTFQLAVRMSTGKEIKSTFRIPYPEHKGIWEEGEYLKGDICTKGSSFWMALEDTSGEPPGNGWQQILSAPRGKTGPPGKSIEGKQGKPGRNGRDAKLPEGFIEEVLELASTNKAFEDGRSGAEVITSFRGYFMPDEAYRVGDVVNFDGAIYLCTSGGTFDSIAKGQDSWELMLSVPKFTTPAYMLWQGAWEQKTYNGGMVVREGGESFVALTQTDDYPAPQPIGDEFWVSMEGDSPTWVSTPSNPVTRLLYGQRYSLPQTLYATGARVWIDEALSTLTYAVWLITDPLGGANLTILMPERSFTSTGWVDIPIPQTLLGEGSAFDILVAKYDRSGGTVFNANYNYLTPPNIAAPGSGQIIHANEALDTINISKTDSDAVDQSANLAQLHTGDLIAANGITWSVVTSVDSGSFYQVEITPSIQDSTDGVQSVGFTTYADQPINYVSIADHYAGEDVQGFYSEGVIGDAVYNDNMYGIDIQIQNVFASPDWDVVSFA